MVERLVICGGLPAKKADAEDVIELDVKAAEGSANRVNLKLGDLSALMVECPSSDDLAQIAGPISGVPGSSWC